MLTVLFIYYALQLLYMGMWPESGRILSIVYIWLENDFTASNYIPPAIYSTIQLHTASHLFNHFSHLFNHLTSYSQTFVQPFDYIQPAIYSTIQLHTASHLFNHSTTYSQPFIQPFDYIHSAIYSTIQLHTASHLFNN